MKKRFLAALLVLIMAISALPFAASAAAWQHTHNWETVTENGQQIRKCTKYGCNAKCGTAFSKHEFEEKTPNQAATCTEDGEGKKVCKKCELVETYTIEATGHSWKDVNIFGFKYRECEKCHTTCKRHDFEEVEPVKAATCTENGTGKKICKTCQAEETYVIRAEGKHTWNHDADGSECTKCGETCQHNFKELPTNTPATCTAAGKGKKECQNPACKYVHEYEIEATGHTWVDSRNGSRRCQKCNATCGVGTNVHTWEAGKCTTCQKECNHESDNYKGHTRFVKPTCTEKGYYEWYNVCKHCKVEYNKRQGETNVPASGHKWVDGVCSVCETSCTHEANGPARNRYVAPTCIEGGFWESYKVCKHCGSDFDLSKTPIAWEKATGHKWNKGVCSVCGDTCEHESVGRGWTETTDATCTEDAYKQTVNRCSNCREIYEVNSETIPNSALGHKYLRGKCVRCGADEPKCQHTANQCEEVTIKNATCTEKGKIAVKCECGHIVRYEDVDALGHNYNWFGQCTRCFGFNTNIPDIDDDNNEEDNDDDHGHHDWPSVPVFCMHPASVKETYTKEATCTTDGHTTVKCTICGYTKVDVIPALGHDEQVVEVESTCKVAGSTTTTCSRCSYKNVVNKQLKDHMYEGGLCLNCHDADLRTNSVDHNEYHTIGNVGK